MSIKHKDKLKKAFNTLFFSWGGVNIMKRILHIFILVGILGLAGCHTVYEQRDAIREQYPDSEIIRDLDDGDMFFVRQKDGSIRKIYTRSAKCTSHIIWLDEQIFGPSVEDKPSD